MFSSFRSLRIDSRGDHWDSNDQSFPLGTVLMAVDNHQFLVDLSKVQGSQGPGLPRRPHDRASDLGQMRGAIIQQDGHRQSFWDKELLRPYRVGRGRRG
jgi:hypothetical protein